MQGRTALITGGGGGIGEATGRLFAEEGGAVALLDANAEAAQAAADGIAASVRGARVLPLVGDVAREAAQGQSEAQLRQRTSRENLLRRWAEPREVAAPILFLSCYGSSYITGTQLMVDAGKSIL